MKKNVWVAVLMLCAFTATAQEYKPVKVGIGLGYASPAGEGSKGGALFYLEPAYRVNDQIAVGLRLEGAVVGRVAVVANSTSGSAEAEVSANASYTANGQYYFLNGTFRPFAGAGFGVYSVASAKVSGSSSGSGSASSEVGGGTKFGFYPRLGFDLGHFSFNLEYNVIPKTETTVIVADGSGGTSTAQSTVKNSYLGVKFGFFIGGGRK
ncbi:MAG: outer membrane beta-barrel protein [Bacteroidota bacterium]